MPRKKEEKKVWKETLPKFKSEADALRFARQAVGSAGMTKVLINGKVARIFGQSIHYEEGYGHVALASEEFSEEKQKAWEVEISKLRTNRRRSPVPNSVEYFQDFIQI